MVQCTAKSKQSQERCKRHAVPGRNVCVMHGGKTPIGPGSASWKHGRYSKLLPPRLIERLEASIGDPDLLAMRDEINLIDARIADVMARADVGESSRLWSALKKAWAEMVEAKRQQDNQQMAYKLNEVGNLIERGYADYAAWDDVLNLVERRRKLVESERKRLVELKLVLTYDQAVVYAQRLNEAVAKYVSSREERAAIALAIRAVVGTVGGLPGPASQ